MKPIVVAMKIHGFFLGFWAIITRMSNIPADLARRASLQGLKCLHFSLNLGIVLEFLEEEINIHSWYVSLLYGVHASLRVVGGGHCSNLGWTPSSQLML